MSSELVAIQTLVNDDANFDPRTYHQVVVYDGKMVVIGGYTGGLPFGSSTLGISDFRNDVWTSQNGTRWTRLTNDAEFPPVMSHKSIVFNGKLLSLTGETRSGDSGDIWSTEDGISWSKAHHQKIELTPVQ